jgi:hypothetical protein
MLATIEAHNTARACEAMGVEVDDFRERMPKLYGIKGRCFWQFPA